MGKLAPPPPSLLLTGMRIRIRVFWLDPVLLKLGIGSRVMPNSQIRNPSKIQTLLSVILVATIKYLYINFLAFATIWIIKN